MTKKASTTGRVISDQLIETVCRRLAEDKRVRRTLPGRGRLHIDRPLPFLCVYRRPPKRADAGTERLVTSEASYLVASASRSLEPSLTALVTAIARTMADRFGSFLVLEIWADAGKPNDATPPAVPRARRPRFRVFADENGETVEFRAALEKALARVKSSNQSARVDVEEAARRWPRDLPPVLPAKVAADLHATLVGLEVEPVYRDPKKGDVYPIVLRELRRGLTRALRQAFYTFACARTRQSPVHYHVLGRRAVVKAVWEVDRRLAEVSDSFDFLLQVTPTNAAAAWQRFKDNRFERAPRFRYRPLPVDPLVLKRQLYEAPVERVEDPTLWQLFRDKQDELDRRLTMLLDLNTNRFVHGSMSLFGGVDDESLQLAEQLLDKLPSRARDDSKGGYVDTATISRRARTQLDRYRKMWPTMKSDIEIRDDIAGGFMVSRGKLLISKRMRVPAARVEALLAHEIGTHIVTYFNGRAQPFRQLYSGLAGYEPLQEGLAVLAEYLVGGLSRPRLRLLAARVVAVRRMLDGASFVETFRELDRNYDFGQRSAFNTVMRVYRGGGLTKDAIYLRGLGEVFDYLARGGELEPLYVGKISAAHIPIIRELQWRNVLQPAPVRPRFLDAPGAAEQLERARSGLSVLQLIQRGVR